MGTDRLLGERQAGRLMPRSLARRWGSPWARDLCSPWIQVALG